MDKAARDLLKSERRRLGLNQTALAEKAGIRQGMISRLEIDPDYEPTVVVLSRAVNGLGLTLSEFFRQLETGLPAAELPGHDQRPSENRGEPHDARPQAQNEDDRRTISLLAKSTLEAQETLAAAQASLAALVKATRDAARQKDLHQARDTRAEKAARPRANGKSRGQPARRSAKRRPGK